MAETAQEPLAQHVAVATSSAATGPSYLSCACTFPVPDEIGQGLYAPWRDLCQRKGIHQREGWLYDVVAAKPNGLRMILEVLRPVGARVDVIGLAE